MRFPNRAGDHPDNDAILRSELKAAGIKTFQEDAGVPEDQFQWIRETSGEVKTSVMGTIHGWTFKRAWYYWVAEGPGLDFKRAMNLWEYHGKEARVSGDCGCRSPLLWYKGLAAGHYHVDTPDGLIALARAITNQVEEAKLLYPDLKE